jgi:lysophospholipase L1-like esterase
MKLLLCLLASLCTLPAVPALAAEADNFQPEPGFKLLFNGRDLTGWGYPGAQAQSFDGLSASPDGRYEGKDGILRVNDRLPRLQQQLATTEPLPANCVIRMDFRPMQWADGGVFVRGTQLQVRDFLTVGPYYDLLHHRPQEWNTLEIYVLGPWVYASTNGEVLEPSFRVNATGTLGFEADLGVMEYRRIRVKELPAGAHPVPAAMPAATTRPNLATLIRPRRVAIVGDEIAQPFPGAVNGTTPRGGIQLPEVSARQLAAVRAMHAAPARALQDLTAARAAVVTASLSAPAEIPARVAAVGEAELALAKQRADLWAWLQDSPQRLNASAVTALVPQVNIAPLTGRGSTSLAGAALPVGRGGAPSGPAQLGPPDNLAPRFDLASLLSRRLGAAWDVRNFAFPGATVQRTGDTSVWGQPALNAAVDFDPDVVLFVFGTNDSKPENWRGAAAFEADYRALATLFAAGPARPRLFLAKPPPAFTAAGGVDEKLLAGDISARIDALARATGASVIDLREALKDGANLTLEGVHPDSDGFARMADRVQAALAALAPAR